MRSAGCEVLGAGCLVLGAKCEVRSAKCEVRSAFPQCRSSISYPHLRETHLATDNPLDKKKPLLPVGKEGHPDLAYWPASFLANSSRFVSKIFLSCALSLYGDVGRAARPLSAASLPALKSFSFS